MDRQFDSSKVAIIIAVYNDRDNIERAIRSAAAQSVPEGTTLDVVVVDDCSTDDSFDVARAVAAEVPRVRVFQCDQNGGPSRARNEALRQTDAGWFMPLDSDDAVAPDRLEKLLSVAQSEQADFVADNLFVTHASHPFDIVRPLWADKPTGLVALSAEYFVNHCFDMPAERSELGYLKPLISRQTIKNSDTPYRPQLKFSEDYELYTRVLLDGAKAVLTDGFGYYFIQRENSSSRSQGGDEHRKIVEIDRAFLKRPDLSVAERRAIRGHMNHAKAEWAKWTLIEAARARNPRKFVSGLFISTAGVMFLWQTLVQKIVSSDRPAQPGDRVDP